MRILYNECQQTVKPNLRFMVFEMLIIYIADKQRDQRQQLTVTTRNFVELTTPNGSKIIQLTPDNSNPDYLEPLGYSK